MTTIARTLRRPWVAKASVLAGLAACSTGPGGTEVEMQIVTGYAVAPDEDYVVRVRSDEEDKRTDLGFGDQVNSSNWARIPMHLAEGERITISVENSIGREVLASPCVVQGATRAGWARVTVYHKQQPPTLSCDVGLVAP